MTKEKNLKQYLRKHKDLKKRVDLFAENNRWAICETEENYKNFAKRLLAFITTEIETSQIKEKLREEK